MVVQVPGSGVVGDVLAVLTRFPDLELVRDGPRRVRKVQGEDSWRVWVKSRAGDSETLADLRLRRNHSRLLKALCNAFRAVEVVSRWDDVAACLVVHTRRG